MELINIQPTGKTPITKSIPVFVITKKGNPYNTEGINFIKNNLEQNFGIKDDLAIYTGIGINDPKTLTTLIESNANAYVVLSAKDNIALLPNNTNHQICDNLKEKPNSSSWEVLMETCGLTESES